jgi:endonuclease III
MLPHHFTAQEMYDHHQVMMFHGQKTCLWRNPDCPNCVLPDICPKGKTILKKAG